VSAQTGTAPPSGPVSQRFVDRARFRVEWLQKQPNPIWIRELKQAARLTRTPVILTVVAVLFTLLMASIGGLMASESSPAKTGVVLFQVFFSIAYFVVTVIGPAVAANTIASEREGHTWEAVILTGVRPETIARGKFLAAYTGVGMYIVMLAPVGALPFLFGGVTALETLVAFLFLFLVAWLSVAFGLAISSKMSSMRGAIVVTLLLAFPLSIFAFSTLGVALSFAAHDAWPAVSRGAPVWLPTAYERAPFGAPYFVFLIALPIAAVAIPAWLLYEVTVANLTSVTDDRSFGVKRWHLVALPVVLVVASLPLVLTGASDKQGAAISALTVTMQFLFFAVFLFAGDPIGPSRRVEIHWDRQGASRIRRFLGPGVMRSAALLLLTGLPALGLLGVLGTFLVATSGTTSAGSKTMGVLFFLGYAAAFYVFTVGLAAFLRARSTTSLVARVLLFAVLFLIAVGPWIVGAIVGAIVDTGSFRDAFVVASPSPFYAYFMIDAATRAGSGTVIVAGLAATVGWVAVGLGLLGAARAKCNRIIEDHELALAEADRRLAQEDEDAAAARAAARAARAAPTPGEAPAGATG
jgi:ABC-type transport system involved in multi-copper enzyme maturation permease subunit